MRHGFDRVRNDGPSIDGASLVGFLVVLLLSLGAFAYYGTDSEAGIRTVSVYQPAGGNALPADDMSAGMIDEVNTTSLGAKATAPAASCNIDSCSNAYRSFRVSDCTFQPYEGPRRLCTRK